MNPLAKAIGTALVLAAGTLGASMQETPFGLPDLPGPWPQGGDSDDGSGNGTGNGTSTQGNGTAGNQTAPGNSTAGNETVPGGNQTAGNQTAPGNQTAEGNETAEPEPETDPDVRAAVCSFDLWESGSDLMPAHHEWEWLVTSDVQHLQVSFWGDGGVPTGLSGHSDARLVDGAGRTIAHATAEGAIDVFLERGVDAMANGPWRLTYDTSDSFADYHVQVSLHCAG